MSRSRNTDRKRLRKAALNGRAVLEQKKRKRRRRRDERQLKEFLLAGPHEGETDDVSV